jgi:hypothetical protein
VTREGLASPPTQGGNDGCQPSHPPPRASPAWADPLDPGLALAALLALPASGLAATGSVYVDSSGNVGAGSSFFNGSFTGNDNVGIGDTVMPNLTDGFNNTAAGSGALILDTTGSNNVAREISRLRAAVRG